MRVAVLLVMISHQQHIQAEVMETTTEEVYVVKAANVIVEVETEAVEVIYSSNNGSWTSNIIK